jgi:hypothetical protein
VQNYTLGIEPAENWGIAKEQASAPLVSWLGRANNTRQSLFRRSYEYDPNGGLRRVPIQVWSTKGFQGQWYHAVVPNQPPFAADLQNAGGDITGSIVSNLPAPLENVNLYYKGNVYPLNRLLPGPANKKQVTANGKVTFTEYFKSLYVGPATQPAVNRFGGPMVTYEAKPVAIGPVHKTVESFLFHEAMEKGGAGRTTKNALLRVYDQSWRVDVDSSGEDAILFGSLAPQKAAAKDIMNSPATATRLRMGSLPGDKGAAPAEILGDMRQDTFIRVVIPVKIKN